MDQSTREQWMEIAHETMANQPRVAEQVLDMVESLENITDGFSINQKIHALQTATRARDAGADEEVVVASLVHDVGKLISVANHPRIAAEILRPYVRDEVFWMIATHQDFQGRHYYAHLGMDPNLREQHRGQPWFDLAERFADEWDQASFDPDFPSGSLEEFAPAVRRVFATPHSL